MHTTLNQNQEAWISTHSIFILSFPIISDRNSNLFHIYRIKRALKDAKVINFLHFGSLSHIANHLNNFLHKKFIANMCRGKFNASLVMTYVDLSAHHHLTLFFALCLSESVDRSFSIYFLLIFCRLFTLFLDRIQQNKLISKSIKINYTRSQCFMKEIGECLENDMFYSENDVTLSMRISGFFALISNTYPLWEIYKKKEKLLIFASFFGIVSKSVSVCEVVRKAMLNCHNKEERCDQNTRRIHMTLDFPSLQHHQGRTNIVKLNASEGEMNIRNFTLVFSSTQLQANFIVEQFFNFGKKPNVHWSNFPFQPTHAQLLMSFSHGLRRKRISQCTNFPTTWNCLSERDGRYWKNHMFWLETWCTFFIMLENW